MVTTNDSLQKKKKQNTNKTNDWVVRQQGYENLWKTSEHFAHACQWFVLSCNVFQFAPRSTHTFLLFSIRHWTVASYITQYKVDKIH